LGRWSYLERSSVRDRGYDLRQLNKYPKKDERHNNWRDCTWKGMCPCYVMLSSDS